jgi:hypothetical protein
MSKGMDAAREAVRRYDALSAKERKSLETKGIDISEVLLIMSLQVSDERKNAAKK